MTFTPHRDSFLGLCSQQDRSPFRTDPRGGIQFDPYFGGYGCVVGAAARACREAISRDSNLCHAEMFMAFEDPTYLLLSVAANLTQGGGTKRFINTSWHQPSPWKFVEGKSPVDGKKVVILSTYETQSDTGFSQTVELLKNRDAQLLGAVIFYSPTVCEKRNSFDYPVIRVIREADLAVLAKAA